MQRIENKPAEKMEDNREKSNERHTGIKCSLTTCTATDGTSRNNRVASRYATPSASSGLVGTPEKEEQKARQLHQHAPLSGTPPELEVERKSKVEMDRFDELISEQPW